MSKKKESERLIKEYREEENDLKAIGIGKKIIREERQEKFEADWLPKFKKALGDMGIWYDEKKYCYSIIWKGHQLDYYPKANNVFLHKEKKWIKPALNWLIRNLNI